MVRASQVAAPPSRLNDLLPALTLESVRLTDLRPSTTKVRRLDAVHIREVAASIARLGFCDPLLIAANDELIDGEICYAAAEQLALERLPCIRVAHLNRDEIRVLRLAVNRLAEKGQWDLDALKIEFEQLIVVDAPIEISGVRAPPRSITLCWESGGRCGLESGPLEPSPGAVGGFKAWRHLHARSAPDRLRRRLRSRTSFAALDDRIDPPARLLLYRRALQRADRRQRQPRRASRVRDGLRRNERRRVSRLQRCVDGGLYALPRRWRVFGTFIDWRGSPDRHAAAIKLA